MQRFIADDMLGKLAKWLRILGYDTLYQTGIEDTELIQRALAEGRIILTRDTHLIKRRLVKNHLLIQSDFLPQQLKQVIDSLQLDTSSYLLTRCLICNQPLTSLDKPMLKDKVPPYVYATQEHFSSCPGCKRIYWPATHVKQLLQKLAAMQK